jgi:DNA-binding Lrp family transcriptional regulator
VPEEPPSPPAEPVAEPSARRPLTPTERRVLGAMNPKVSMRKHEIAIMVGIGRGSCNRIIDRLVSEGICRETMPLRYVIVQEASA